MKITLKVAFHNIVTCFYQLSLRWAKFWAHKLSMRQFWFLSKAVMWCVCSNAKEYKLFTKQKWKRRVDIVSSYSLLLIKLLRPSSSYKTSAQQDYLVCVSWFCLAVILQRCVVYQFKGPLFTQGRVVINIARNLQYNKHNVESHCRNTCQLL